MQYQQNPIRAKLIFALILSLACGAFADSTFVAVTDTNVLNGLSPLNWVRKTDFIASSICGASLKAGFTGTGRVSLRVDTRNLATKVAARFPILAWSVNLGPLQTHQLIQGETSVLLSTGVANPSIDFYLKGISPFENRYAGDAPDNAVKITGFVLDAGGSCRPVTQQAGLWMNIGNSIESGDAAAYASGQGRPPDDNWAASDDGRASYGYLLAKHYGYRESRLAYGGYNWGGGGAGCPNLSGLLDNITSTVSRLTGGVFVPRPDIVLINLGENGVPASADVIDALTKLRLRAGAATRIIVMIPVSGTSRAAVTDAYTAYRQKSNDPDIHLVDLGKLTFATADGQHPTAAGHVSIYNAALPAFDKIIPQPTGLHAIPAQAKNPLMTAPMTINARDSKGRRTGIPVGILYSPR